MQAFAGGLHNHVRVRFAINVSSCALRFKYAFGTKIVDSVNCNTYIGAFKSMFFCLAAEKKITYALFAPPSLYCEVSCNFVVKS